MSRRNVHFFDMVLSSRGKLNRANNPIDFEATPKSITDIAKEIQKLFNSGDNLLQQGRTSTSCSHYLKDFRLNSNEIIMLVNRCDPNAPDMVTSDPLNNVQQVHPIPPGHGGDYSAHVIIKTTPVVGDSYYLCMIETLVGSGLNSTAIKSYLNSILRKCRAEFPENYKIPDISDPEIKVRHVHQLNFHGHPSASFLEDLENGSISDLEAISYSEQGATLDQSGAIIERYRTIKLKADSNMITDIKKSLSNLRSKLLSEYVEYPYLRLRFNDADGNSRSAEILVENGHLVDNDRYVKKFELKSLAVNQTGYATINNAIIKEILSHA